MTKENYPIENEDDDADFQENWSDGHAPRPAPKKSVDVSARRAIEDYMEEKRMREILDDELFHEPQASRGTKRKKS